MRMLDLYCGKWGLGRAFAARRWSVTGVDLREPEETPHGCIFRQADILLDDRITAAWIRAHFDFVWASSPCEQFSVRCMKFTKKKDHPYPELGIRLFNHTRALCEAAGVPYVMENVRCAQQFVGDAVNHCGPFYLWGNAVPPLLNQGITKGSMIWSPRYRNMKKSQRKIEVATIPPELANCVAEYAERICEASVK